MIIIKYKPWKSKYFAYLTVLSNNDSAMHRNLAFTFLTIPSEFKRFCIRRLFDLNEHAWPFIFKDKEKTYNKFVFHLDCEKLPHDHFYTGKIIRNKDGKFHFVEEK
jgi:hypothetical protein